MKNKILLLILILSVFMVVPYFSSADTCTTLASCGTQNNWKSWGQCLTNGGQNGNGYICDSVRISPGGSYALARAAQGSTDRWFLYRKAANSWSEITSPSSCSLYTSGMSLIGWDKTTSSSSPFVLLYAKLDNRQTGWPTWFTGSKGWEYDVITANPTSSCSGCGCWGYAYGYKNDKTQVADFADNAAFSFTCIKSGNGYIGSSNDAECWWGGKKGPSAQPTGTCGASGATQCYQGYAITLNTGASVGWWNDPGYSTGNTPINNDYTLAADSRLYIMNPYTTGTANYAPQVYELASYTGGGSFTYRSASSGLSGTMNSPFYADFGSTVSSAIVMSASGNKVLKLSGSSFINGNVPAYLYAPNAITKGKRLGTNVIWGMTAAGDIAYITQSNIGSGGWTTDSCYRSSSQSVVSAYTTIKPQYSIMDYDTSSGTGWALPTYTGGEGCVPTSYGIAPPPFGCSACGTWSGSTCAGQGTIKQCLANQVFQSKTCPSTCADPCVGEVAGSCESYVSGTNKIAEKCVDNTAGCTGSETAKCKEGGTQIGGTPYYGSSSPNGIPGSNWWLKSYIGSEPTQSTPCPSTDVGSTSSAFGSSLTITNRVFHNKNLAATVTLQFVDKVTGVVVGTKTLTASGTNKVGGVNTDFSLNSAADYDSVGLCGGRNYSVSPSVRFTISSSSYDWWQYQPFTLKVIGSGGAYCTYNKCSEINMNCGQGGCVDPTPRYYKKTCTNNFNDTQITYSCKADATCNQETCVFNQTIQDCGANGCGATELPDQYYCVNGSRSYYKTVCRYDTSCTSTCTAWENRGCGGTKCTFYNGLLSTIPNPPSSPPTTDYLDAYPITDPTSKDGSNNMQFLYYYVTSSTSGLVPYRLSVEIYNSSNTRVYYSYEGLFGGSGLRNGTYTAKWVDWLTNTNRAGQYTAKFYLNPMVSTDQLKDTLIFNLTAQNIFYQQYQQRSCNVLPGDSSPSGIVERCYADDATCNVCTPTAWVNRSCAGTSDAGCSCGFTQRLQTRTVNPGGCGITCQCISDSSCVAPVGSSYVVEATMEPSNTLKLLVDGIVNYRAKTNLTGFQNFTIGFWENNNTLVKTYTGPYWSTTDAQWGHLPIYWDDLRNYATSYVIRISGCLATDGSKCNSTEVPFTVIGPALRFTGNATTQTPTVYPSTSGGADSFVKGDPNLKLQSYFVGQLGSSGTITGTLTLTVCEASNATSCNNYPGNPVTVTLGSGVQTLASNIPDWTFLKEGTTYNVNANFYVSATEDYTYTYSFFIKNSQNSVVFLSLSASSLQYGENLQFIVRPNSTESVTPTVWFEFFNSNNEYLDKDSAEGVVFSNGVYTTYNFTKWNNYLWLNGGSTYKVCAKARWSSTTPAQDCKYFTLQTASFDMTFGASNTEILYQGKSGDSVTYTATPFDTGCNGVNCLPAKVTIYYSSHSVGLGGQITTCTDLSLGCAKVFAQYAIVPSNTSVTFNLNENNFGTFNLEEGKYYAVFAVADFVQSGQTVSITSPVSDLYIRPRNFDQTGFAPMRTTITVGDQERIVAYGNNMNGPFICIISEDMTSKYCYNKGSDGNSLEIDYLTGVTVVKGTKKGILNTRDSNQIVFTGWSQSSEFAGVKVAKFGVIDPIGDGILGGSDIGSGAVVMRSLNPADPNSAGLSCISNPVRMNCPGTVGIAAGICFSDADCAAQAATGGEFGFVYYVGRDAYFTCAGSDGLFRGTDQGISNYAGNNQYYGDCLIRGGINAVDLNGDGVEEIIGAGGIINLVSKSVTDKFGEDKAIAPVDINSDGFIDFVSQSENSLEVWMGSSELANDGNDQLNGSLAILAITPCTVDSDGVLSAFLTASPGGISSNLLIYSLDPGDGSGWITHSNTIEPWLSNVGARPSFSPQYTATGTYTVTGKVSQPDGTSATKTCSVTVSNVPNYYNFSGTYNGVCGISRDGLFTSYFDDVTENNWKSINGVSVKGGPDGIQFGSTQRYTIIHDVKSERNEFGYAIKFTADATLRSDFTYSARQIGTETQADIAKLRIKDGKLYYLTVSGQETKMIDLVVGQTYDARVAISFDKITSKVTSVKMYGGLQGTETQLGSTVSLSDIDVDIYSGKLKLSYVSGTGYLKVFDFFCGVNGTTVTQPLKEGEATAILRAAGITSTASAVGQNCISGEPAFFDYGNQTTGNGWFADNESKVHSKSLVSYPNVGSICGNARTGVCGYAELKSIVRKYPSCYKEAHNYCVDVAYRQDVDQADATADGPLACTTILMSSTFFDRAAKPVLNVFIDLMIENWFITIVIIIIVIIGASFAGNRRK